MMTPLAQQDAVAVPSVIEGLSPQVLESWETFFNIAVPTDAQGNKQYQPDHIRFFKAVDQLLSRGKSLDEIGALLLAQEAPQPTSPHVVEPPAPPAPEATAPLQQTMTAVFPVMPTVGEPTSVAVTTEPPRSPEVVSLGQRFVQEAAPSTDLPPVSYEAGELPSIRPNSAEQETLQQLFQQLSQERDNLRERLLESEKLNTHLYNTNEMFRRKVRDLTESILRLKEKSKEGEVMKLLEDKAKLQRELIDVRRHREVAERSLADVARQLQQTRHEYQDVCNRLDTLRSTRIPQESFYGVWQEEAALQEVVYDQIGLNMETTRTRQVAIEHNAYMQQFGASLMFTTHYQYETNQLWQRRETVVLSWINDTQLEGPIFVEYLLEGKPVARAIYTATYNRA